MYGEMWAAALVAAAFTGTAREAVETSLTCVPPGSRLAEAVRFVLDRHTAGDTWEAACATIRSRYGHYSWVHTVNNAALGATALTACGSGAGASGNRITFWDAFASKDIEKYFQQHFIDGYNRTATGAKGAPAPVQMAEKDFPKDIDPRIKRQYLQLGTAKNIGYTTWTFWPAKSDTYIYEQMEKVLTGSLSPKDYCAGLDKLFQQELKSGKLPTAPAPEGA
ncbi:hypothetical protein ACFC09_17530 [Streptomyces sp. NPDC056161]|uniref:hypothetical protein n=1 Tax=Streptomyces sp. NPDC056161 TaxID=3345732 RepID=UPI0035DAF0FD